MVVALSRLHAFALLAYVQSVQHITERLFLKVWILSVAFILTLAIGRALLGRSASRPVTMSSDLGYLKPWLLLVLVCICRRRRWTFGLSSRVRRRKHHPGLPTRFS